MRKIYLSYQKNARDLGGYTGFNGKKVKIGRVFRGGSLHKVNDEDVEIINSLHLTDIIDLRGKVEFESHPDYPFDGVTFHNISPIYEGVKKGKQKYADSNLLWFLGEDEGFEHMCNIYREITVSNHGIAALKEAFKLLSIDNKTFYFHCSQGKDRAGMIAYFFLIALGVSEEEARKDYLESNVAMEVKIAELKEMLHEEDYFDEEYERSMRDVFSAREEFLDCALKTIKEKYGSVDNYLRTVLEIDIEKLRENYLEN